MIDIYDAQASPTRRVLLPLYLFLLVRFAVDGAAVPGGYIYICVRACLLVRVRPCLHARCLPCLGGPVVRRGVCVVVANLQLASKQKTMGGRGRRAWAVSWNLLAAHAWLPCLCLGGINVVYIYIYVNYNNLQSAERQVDTRLNY